MIDDTSSAISVSTVNKGEIRLIPATDANGHAIRFGGNSGGTTEPKILRFLTSGDAERMRIDSSGNVGIGTSSPSSLLHLSSTSTELSITTTNQSNSARVNITGGTSSYAGINFGDSDADSRGALRYYNSDDSLRFVSAGSERMRIASNGVVTVKNGAVAEIDTLTSASTVTPDFAASCNFTLTLGTNVTLANPTNLTAGQSGSIFLVQDGTGSRTITFGSYWDFAGGTAPTISSAANTVDRLDYIVRNSTSIHAVVTLAYS